AVGRNRPRNHSFMHRRFLLSKNRAASRCKNHFRNPGGAARLQYVQGPGSIGLEIQLRIGKRFPHPRMSGQMYNDIDSFGRFCQSSRISNITDVQIHTERIDVLALSEAEVIEYADTRTLLNQARYQIDADKPAAS